MGLEILPERVGGSVSMAKKRAVIGKAWDKAQRRIDELKEKSREAEKRKQDAVDAEAAAELGPEPKKKSRLGSRGRQGGGRQVGGRDRLAY